MAIGCSKLGRAGHDRADRSHAAVLFAHVGAHLFLQALHRRSDLRAKRLRPWERLLDVRRAKAILGRGWDVSFFHVPTFAKALIRRALAQTRAGEFVAAAFCGAGLLCRTHCCPRPVAALRCACGAFKGRVCRCWALVQRQHATVADDVDTIAAATGVHVLFRRNGRVQQLPDQAQRKAIVVGVAAFGGGAKRLSHGDDREVAGGVNVDVLRTLAHAEPDGFRFIKLVHLWERVANGLLYNVL